MHECLLCEKDMKKSKNTFGAGCLKNIYSFLDIEVPKKAKLREETLYHNIMKLNGVNSLNKKQRIILTDRYLTLKYLEEIGYISFDNIKNEINEDIHNVSKISKLEDMLSSKKMSLKHAYDLYKKATKFKDGIKELKKGNFKDEESIKLLISSFSYIFNLYKNKNQYDKDMSKALQFAFWQTVVEIGREYANYDISADLLQHSLKEQPADMLITEGKIISKIVNDEDFKKVISDIIKDYGKKSNNFLFDSDKDHNYSMKFSENDLYYSLNKVALYINAKKQEGKWCLEINLHDRYDYTNFKGIKDYYKDTKRVIKSIFSSTLYNLAWLSVKYNVIKEYNIDIKFRIDNFEVE